jgi:hypothetical protein
MGKKSRTKGAAFEREVANLISPYWPDAKRNLDQYQTQDGRDLSETRPICMQLKRRKRTQLWEIKMAWVEANEAASVEYPYPMAVWRDDGGETWCMMKMEHVVEWLCALEDGML